MPWRKSRKVLNHLSLACPKSTTSDQESAAQITAQTATTIMSANECRLPRARRGSGKSAKCREIESVLPDLLKNPVLRRSTYFHPEPENAVALGCDVGTAKEKTLRKGKQEKNRASHPDASCPAFLSTLRFCLICVHLRSS